MRFQGKIDYRSHRRAASKESGIAVVVTLLILMLLIAMTLGMTIAVTSDTLITRYYRNFRSSFYAADSGVNIAREYMLTQLNNRAVTVGQTYASNAQPPLSSTDVANALSSLNTAYSSYTSLLAGEGASSWPGSFEIVGTQSGTPGTTLAGCTMGASTCTAATPTCSVGYTQPTSGTMNSGPYTCTNVPQCTGTCTGFSATFSYSFPYTITAIGESLASEQQIVEDSGNLIVTVNVGSATSYQQSFAAWGMFIGSSPICNGSTLVGGTISGPVFTNGSWNFGTSSYTFTDSVGSAGADFGYQISGSECDQLATSSDKKNGTTIAPNFEGGYNLGQSAVSLPSNSYSQEWAVLNGLGTSTTNPTNAQLNAALHNYADVAYPTSGTSSGVYMGYTTTTTGGVTTNTMTGGGILVQGNASDVTLTASTASAANNPVTGIAANDSLQVIAVTQGSTTTTVYEDLTSSTTYMKQGSTVTKIAGLPQNYNTTPSTPSTMVYVNGNIGTSTTTGLSGPGQGLPAIQNAEEMTVTAAGNINITGDILYKTEPINTPADTVNTANNSDQVLGIFTPTGNIQLYNQQSSGNLEIDASLAMISANGSGGLVNNGNAINELTIIGGRIQNTIQDINTTTRNVWYDRRFAQGNFAPPWFPSTTVTPSATDTVNSTTPSFTRTSWLAPNQ